MSYVSALGVSDADSQSVKQAAGHYIEVQFRLLIRRHGVHQIGFCGRDVRDLCEHVVCCAQTLRQLLLLSFETLGCEVSRLQSCIDGSTVSWLRWRAII